MTQPRYGDSPSMTRFLRAAQEMNAAMREHLDRDVANFGVAVIDAHGQRVDPMTIRLEKPPPQD